MPGESRNSKMMDGKQEEQYQKEESQRETEVGYVGYMGQK